MASVLCVQLPVMPKGKGLQACDIAATSPPTPPPFVLGSGRAFGMDCLQVKPFAATHEQLPSAPMQDH